MKTLQLLLCLGLMAACGAPHEKVSITEADKTASSLSTVSEASLTALADPAKTGSFKVRSYKTNLANSAYSSAIVYYPVDATDRVFAATTLSGGYTNTKEYMAWLGSHFASHGIITIIFTPTNTMSVDPRIWAQGHEGALNQLEKENNRSGSPIAKRVDLTKLGIMGYSMGGAGTLLAVNKLGTRVKAAVGLCAYNPAVLSKDVALLQISGTQDTVASPARIENSVKAARSAEPIAFAKFNGLRHQDGVFGGRHHAEIARFATAWYKVFLEGDASYKSYLNGEDRSIFAKADDFFYKE